MRKTVFPKAFLIAETNVDDSGLSAALAHIGVPNWASDGGSDAERLTEFAGKLCYMSFDTKLNANLTKVGGRSTEKYIQEGIIAHKHGSVLEHSTVTFLLTDVSRVVTHELVRHRAGTAFSQTSGRYVRTEEVNLYVPRDIAENPKAVAIFQRAQKQMEENAKELAEVTEIEGKPFPWKKRLTSAFRRVLGEGHTSNIVVTANHRAWRHMIEMRTDRGAEEEIRYIFADISKQLRGRYGSLYSDAEVTMDDWIETTKFPSSKV